MSGKSSKYVLDQYLGLDKDRFKKSIKKRSRATTTIKTYPMI
jgi:hypothetical protein